MTTEKAQLLTDRSPGSPLPAALRWGVVKSAAIMVVFLALMIAMQGAAGAS